MGVFAQQVQPMKFSFKKHTIMLFACVKISLEVRCFTGDFSKQKIQDRTNVTHDQNTPIAQAVSVWNEETRKRSERGWVATQWAQIAACSSSDEHRKVKKKKKHDLHNSRLRNCDQTAIPPLFEGSCQIKSPVWIIRGDSCYKKGAGRIENTEQAIWRHCMFDAIVLGEYQSLRSCISISARQRIPLGYWMQAGRECPWISLETCPTDQTQDRRHTDKRLPSILQQRAEC